MIIYDRVSSTGQKEDLKNQIKFLREYANAKGIIVDEVVTDVGSGLNFKRKNWNELLTRAQNKEISQILIAHKTLGICRYLYNLYLASNFEVYENLGKGFFITGYTFDKYVNHMVKKELAWIDECGAKARKQALMNAERAFKNYMSGKTNRPKFKKKRQQRVKAYFPKNNKGDWTIWRHKIQVPTIGIVKLKEKGYLPTNTKVTSSTISYKAGKYYVSVLVEIPDKKSKKLPNEGIGIDLGVKNLAIMSNGVVKPNINKTPKVIKLNRKLRREQRRLSRKYDSKKKRGEKTAAYSVNIENYLLMNDYVLSSSGI